MAKTPTQLQATISANFPDNTSAEITPALLRAQQNEAVTSFNYGAYLTSNTTIESASINYCDTSAGAFSLTLPTSPATGDMIRVRDVSGTWSTANLSLLPGSNKIESVTGTFVCDISDANFDLIWRGGSIGWGMQFGVSLIERKPQVISVGTLASTGSAALAATASSSSVRVMALTGTSAVAWVGAVPTVAANWNPADKAAAITLSNGNLTATLGTTPLGSGVRGTPGQTGHKFFEVTIGVQGGGTTRLGIASSTAALLNFGRLSDPTAVVLTNGGNTEGAGGTTNVFASYGTGDVVGVELWDDGVTNKIAFWLNGVWKANVNTLPTGSVLLYPCISFATVNDAATANFGASEFAFPIPSGATPWNT